MTTENKLREALRPFAEAAKRVRVDDPDNDRPALATAAHYRRAAEVFAAPAPADPIPAGMKAWPGGDSAPEDWDGGPVLHQSGRLRLPFRQNDYTWKHAGPHSRGHAFDVIAYTPRAQPEPAAQGEVERVAIALHVEQRKGWQTREEAERDWHAVSTEHWKETARSYARAAIAARLASPPSHALDAATIERSLDQRPDGWSWSLGEMMGLPQALRYRCFLSDHNTPDGKATRHVCEDRASPVEAIEAAIKEARALQRTDAGENA